MMPRFRLFFCFIATSVFSLSTFAQQPAPPPKLETARQALIEIVTKGRDGLQKHLTVEVQDILKSNGKANALALGWMGSMTPEGGLQSFETGDVLFTYDDSAQHKKYEVHVDSDDLAGDEDSMQFSIHAFRDGKELDDEWGIMSSRFTVSMKLQQNIWRVDKISIGADFPVGDPKFFAKTLFPMASGKSSGVGAVAGFHVSQPQDAPVAAMLPDQVVRMLAFAENAFAPQHPETGFTCSLSDLSEWSKMMSIDPQVLSGTYNGYRFALTGCEGRPAGSFQITAEPVLAQPGIKAFCTDATQNLRADDNGHGAACLASGKVYPPAALLPEEAVDVHVHAAEPTPKP
jgi:hypothetical protein